MLSDVVYVLRLKICVLRHVQHILCVTLFCVCGRSYRYDVIALTTRLAESSYERRSIYRADLFTHGVEKLSYIMKPVKQGLNLLLSRM